MWAGRSQLSLLLSETTESLDADGEGVQSDADDGGCGAERREKLLKKSRAFVQFLGVVDEGQHAPAIKVGDVAFKKTKEPGGRAYVRSVQATCHIHQKEYAKAVENQS